MSSTTNEIATLAEEPTIPVADVVAPSPFSNRRAYAQTFAATVAIRCLGALSGVLAARILRPAGRGELAVIVFAPIMLLSLGEFEFSRSVIVESSKDEVSPARLTSTAFWVSLAMGCVEMLLLAVALAFFLPADKLHLLGAARWFALYLPASYVAASLIGIDQGRGRFGRFSVYQALPGLIYVALIVALLWPSHSATAGSFALAMLVGMLVAVILRSASDGANIFGVRPDARLASRLFRRGFTFYVPSLAALLLLRADMFLLVRLAPAAAIGSYAVAQAIAMGQVGVINPFIQVGFAAVAKQPDEPSALATLAHHFKLAQLAAFAMAAVAAALTPWAIRVFFGAEFSPATTATYFLIAAAAFWGVGEMLEQGLRAAGHPRLGMIASLFGLALLLAAAVPAYHRYGITGLAGTVCFAQGVSLIALIALCVSRLHMSIRSFWAFDRDTFRRLYSVFATLLRRPALASSGA
jgi:enterobacterial common antigen flippase